MFNKLKKFLTAAPVQLNGNPIQTWKLLLPILLLSLIPLIPLISPLFHRPPPTPDEIARQKYEESKEQAQTLSQTVAKQAKVPTDETPNVATISDVTLLQDQEFFKQAQNGDKVLIYEKAKLIVLYRPSEDKVIGTAPVLYNSTPTPSLTATPSAN